MKIYFSNYKLKSMVNYIKENTDLDIRSLNFVGYARNERDIEKYFPRFGLELVDNPYDADIELFAGPIFLKLKPDMKPNVIMTMYEFETLPDEILFPLYNWDNIWVPSTWVKEIFERENLPADIFVEKLGIDVERFAFLEREIPKKYVYFLHICTQLNDRKGSFYLLEAFSNYNIHPDASLVIKASGFNSENETEMALYPNVFFIQRVMSDVELLELFAKCHVIIHPSTGEGFGMPPLEGALTGLLPLPGYSTGMRDWIEEIGCSYIEMKKSSIDTGDRIVWEPDIGSILEQVEDICEDKEKIIEKGRYFSEIVREKYDWNRIVPRLKQRFEEIVYSTSKEILDKRPVNFQVIDDYIDTELIMNVGKDVLQNLDKSEVM